VAEGTKNLKNLELNSEPLQNSPIIDNNFNRESSWKVAFRPSHTNIVQTASRPKPKKQHKTQKANAESLNFSKNKSLTKKTQTQNKPQQD